MNDVKMTLFLKTWHRPSVSKWFCNAKKLRTKQRLSFYVLCEIYKIVKYDPKIRGFSPVSGPQIYKLTSEISMTKNFQVISYKNIELIVYSLASFCFRALFLCR